MTDPLAVARQPGGAVGEIATVLLLANRQAEVGLGAAAVDALAALGREQRDDVIAGRDQPCVLADPLDDAGALVPEHGRCVSGGIGARGRVEIRVADAARLEPHERLARPRLLELISWTLSGAPNSSSTAARICITPKATYDLGMLRQPHPWGLGNRQMKPYLSVCSIYRDHAGYLREWIEFHRLVGVERFFLYDNESTTTIARSWSPTWRRGIVVIHEWPSPASVERGVPWGLIGAFNDCLERHRHDSRWLAFIDIDEFLFSPTSEPLPDVLHDYEPYPGVCVDPADFEARAIGASRLGS